MIKSNRRRTRKGSPASPLAFASAEALGQKTKAKIPKGYRQEQTGLSKRALEHGSRPTPASVVRKHIGARSPRK